MLHHTLSETIQNPDLLYHELVQDFTQHLNTEYEEFIDSKDPEDLENFYNPKFIVMLKNRKASLQITDKNTQLRSNDFLIQIFDVFHRNQDQFSSRKEAVKKLFNEHIGTLKHEFADKEYIDFNDAEIINRLAEYKAISDFIEHLQKQNQTTEQEQTTVPENIQKTTLRWKKDNTNEFAQFVHALYKAGYLTNESGKITELVKEMAQVFNFTLATNWEASLSDSYLYTNSDYMPKIFPNLKQAFEDEREEKLTKKKKT